SATVTAANASADLAVTKTDTPDPVVAGQSLTYTISVTNNGPSDAEGVTLTDNFPPGLTFQGANASQGAGTLTGSFLNFNFGTIRRRRGATAHLLLGRRANPPNRRAPPHPGAAPDHPRRPRPRQQHRHRHDDRHEYRGPGGDQDWARDRHPGR